MTTYRVTVDRNLCSGFATCVELAPHLFRLESDGLASTVVAETGDAAGSRCDGAMPDGRHQRCRGHRRRTGGSMTVLIAGAGLAGARCAETLRSLGWPGRIVLAGDEHHEPYERPALSKELLAGSRTEIALRPAGFWAEHDIELRTGRRVHSLDTGRRTARLDDEELEWDAFVIATGARARRLDGPAGVHHLRTLDDAHSLATTSAPMRGWSWSAPASSAPRSPRRCNLSSVR